MNATWDSNNVVILKQKYDTFVDHSGIKHWHMSSIHQLYIYKIHHTLRKYRKISSKTRILHGNNRENNILYS